MKKREHLRAKEALALWEDMFEKGETEAVPSERMMFRLLSKYENYICTKNTMNQWNVYKDRWVQALQEGFLNYETRLPVMKLSAGLRYLHKNGIPQNYKLSQLRSFLKDKGWIISTGFKMPDRVTRSHLNKLIGEWNGVR